MTTNTSHPARWEKEPQAMSQQPASQLPSLSGRSRQPQSQPRPQRAWLHVSLFALTFLSAMWSQALVSPQNTAGAFLAPLWRPALLLEGLSFATALMAILLAHEMGHYVTARLYGVDQSLPYFIPAPTLFGTLGAVILMRSQPSDRRALLHVAVNGPYAGLVLAVPVAAWGLAHSVPIEPSAIEPGSLWLGSSLLFQVLESWFSPNGADVILHPVGLAGWVGLFVTSLNLIPAAQLDGGHVAYAVFGRRQVQVSLAVVVGLLTLGLMTTVGSGEGSAGGGGIWIVWALLLFWMGVRHPPVRNPALPLTRGQRWNAALAMVVFVLTFIPVPIKVIGPMAAG